MKELKLSEWDRREAYAFFSRVSDPFYMVTFRQDVTALRRYTRARGLSFYMSMVWACTKAVNSVSAFLTAVRDGRIVLLDRRNPSFTDLRDDSEQFRIITMDFIEDPDAFCLEAARVRGEQEGFIDLSSESDSLIYYSCLPWLDLTAMTNERDLSAPGALDDSIPRLAWGRCAEENGRWTLGLSMEVNHRFVDGVHIGRFAQRLSQLTEGLVP